MTKSDWARAKAETLLAAFSDHRKTDVESIATALRDAEKAGMLAGLMKAGAIATLEPDFHMKSEYQMGYEAGRNTAATAIYSEATAIRAAKEPKE